MDNKRQMILQLCKKNNINEIKEIALSNNIITNKYLIKILTIDNKSYLLDIKKNEINDWFLFLNNFPET